MNAVATIMDLTTSPSAAPRAASTSSAPVRSACFLAALLQTVEGQRIRLYEGRSQYTRTRMVSLARYLVSDSVDAYREDLIDFEDIAAIFEPAELEARMAYRPHGRAGPEGAAGGVEPRASCPSTPSRPP